MLLQHALLSVVVSIIVIERVPCTEEQLNKKIRRYLSISVSYKCIHG